jgi:hypothetical protein
LAVLSSTKRLIRIFNDDINILFSTSGISFSLTHVTTPRIRLDLKYLPSLGQIKLLDVPEDDGGKVVAAAVQEQVPHCHVPAVGYLQLMVPDTKDHIEK